MPATFKTTRRVEFGDTDMAGIVHFANFFRYMEAAETEFLRSLGLSVKMKWDGIPLGLPRVAASCDYLRPVRFEDLLDVTVTVLKLGRSSVSYRFEFYKGDEEVARGQVTAVFCKIHPEQGIEAVDIPEAIRAKLA